MIPPPPGSWSPDELRRDADEARRRFVADRLAALRVERETYERAHREGASAARALLGATSDMSEITGRSLEDRRCLEFARQLAVPPISADDLDTLTDSVFKNWLKQKTDRGARPDAEAFDAAATIISERLDQGRAPWLIQGRAATQLELETFVDWAAAGPAAARVMTERRTGSSARQERATREAARLAGYASATPPANLRNPIADMPGGTYAAGARKLSGTSMDVPIRLPDGHPTGLLFLAVECKVSNSSVNSRKRLLEVLSKRRTWDGSGQVYSFRTAAVLSGVFAVDRLLQAQQEGVMLFWEHRLDDFTALLRG